MVRDVHIMWIRKGYISLIQASVDLDDFFTEDKAFNAKKYWEDYMKQIGVLSTNILYYFFQAL